MVFALQLQEWLDERHEQLGHELAAGESLRTVLTRHLNAVEEAASDDFLTSILLLDEEGKHLWHGAAPRLPESYCKAIDGAKIGPQTGSCGTAAYVGHPIYVTDIETDPLWADYRDIALSHGLKACWSTPIFNAEREVIGTFAIYHLTSRSPTREEVDAIHLITDRVADAIIAYGQSGRSRRVNGKRAPAALMLVADSGTATTPEPLSTAEMLTVMKMLEDCAAKCRRATSAESVERRPLLQDVANDLRRILKTIRR